MNISDIDTDIIIPAQYLTSTSQKGYGQHAFARLKADKNFILNQPQYKNAPLLLTGANFGCGSSREHAVWALQEMGIQAIIAPSFADIFANNASKNGLLLIQQEPAIVDDLMQKAHTNLLELNINIEKQTIKTTHDVYNFHIDEFFKHCLINGLDELDYLLSHLKDIKTFKQKQRNTSVFLKPQ